MAYQRGDVLLVPFPFSDLSASKVRPAVVISGTLYHANEPDMILAAITSQIAKATGELDYIMADWKMAGLRYPSALKPVIFTLDPTRVIHHVGKLTSTDLTQVEQRLRRALELDEQLSRPSVK